ncbi:ubiquitin-like domain-containing protein [Streptomyces griseoviridis]|uniref:ubiquitin-like domain-containing protein n=1 Tax=Streptomyces griseoviridis TaxID=45398 RepID=UPI0033E63C30
MKIIEKAGEQPSPALHRRIAAEVRPLLAVSGAGTALWAGTLTLTARGWARLGRHVTGWERWAACGFAAYVLTYTGRLYPEATTFVVPVLLIAWCVAAWCFAPAPAPVRRPAADTERDPAVDAEEKELTVGLLADAVRRVAGPRQGAHLAQLLTEPEFKGWEQADLKAEITDQLGVPVESFKLILAGRQRTRDGVRLRHLPQTGPGAPAEAAPQAPSGGPAGPAPRPLPDPSQGSE